MAALHNVSYLSQFFTLHPGDTIATGTPLGGGLGMSPSTLLTPGQTVRLSVEGLEEERQRIIVIDVCGYIRMFTTSEQRLKWSSCQSETTARMNTIPTEVWTTAQTDVVFLGAGFSRSVTGGESPLMMDFFEKLDDRRYWLLSKFLAECFENPHEANVEEALLKLDQLCLGPLQGKDAFIDQCRARQTDLKKELDQYIIERLGHLQFAAEPWAGEMLIQASDETTVITTNYDNLAESILSRRDKVRHRTANANCHHCKLCRILTDECIYGGAIDESNQYFWKGSLLKLHGSVAWKMCATANCGSQLCLVPDPHCRPLADEKCDCCNQPCSPVLVHPSMQKRFDQFRGLRRMWEGAYEALLACDSILFFGFSFPTTDSIISEMIRCTLARSASCLHVAIIDVDPNKPLERLKQMLHRRSGPVEYSLFEVPLDSGKPDWFVQENAAQ